MKDLAIPLTTLPKVGPKTSKLLENLGLKTIEDLLYHFPFRYEDLTKIKKIKDLQVDETVTIEATVAEINNVFTKYKKRLTKAKAIDSSGELEIVWFNQHYLINSIKKGKRYYFSGKVGSFNGKKTLVSPQYEAIKENSLNAGRLVPIYPETKGLNSKWLRSEINLILDTIIAVDPIMDILPESLRTTENLLEINEALNKIHFPDTEKDIDLARKRLGFEELFIELLKVEQQKHAWHEEYEGVKLDYKKYDKEISEFIISLPFNLTESQKKVINEIHSDLDTTHPMNRLLEGDVGSGKTVVAIVASYLAHLNGYKTLYMAPTEILANQHYETYKKFMGNLDLQINLHTGNNKSNISELNNDIVIGTHALLYEKEQITNVGLVIIDEQHRFGVEQRAKLLNMGVKKQLSKKDSDTKNTDKKGSKQISNKKDENKVLELMQKPNLLTMTATPIPRTLALTIYGDLDLSVLDSVPNKDKKITTKVMSEKMREKAMTWIKDRGEQAFIVCPFIEESEHEMFENVKAAEVEYEKLKNGVFKNLRVGLLHGRMSGKEKDKVMQDFRDKKYQILVATPVIEVGVDIPDATIIVIESAERYGLASLHQLRGRVGRGSKEGFCFLFMSSFSDTSYERLKNLESIDSGLKLAEIDMQYRGQGDVFGTIQHGFKQFKIADLTDIEMIEKTKKAAQKYYLEIDEHKPLKAIINSNSRLVLAN